MSNYIPNKTKAFGDQNLPWVNVEIENLITAKNEVFKKFQKIIKVTIILTNIKDYKES